jgi:ligand-binding sensor domain-containing protein
MGQTQSRLIKNLLFCVLVLLPVLNSLAQIAPGQWRVHLPYNDVYDLEERGSEVFVASEKGFYSFNKNTGEMRTFSPVDGFSDVEVSVMRYQKASDILLIAYQSTNIDLIKGNKIVNISDLFRKQILGRKEINSVNFDGSSAWISTSFGLILLDMEREEIRESYTNIGPGGNALEVFSSALFNNYVYAATPIGILRGDPDDNLSDYNNWEMYRPAASCNHLQVFGNRLYADVDSVLGYYTSNGNWQLFQGNVKRNTVVSRICNGKLIIGHHGGIWTVNENYEKDSLRENVINTALLDDDGIVWTGGARTGLIRINPQTLEYRYAQPPGPSFFTSYEIANLNDEIWVTAGGFTPTIAPTFNGNLYYRFVDEGWRNKQDNDVLRGMWDFTAIEVNRSRSEVWMGSHGKGLAQFRNGEFVAVYDETNSTLRKVANIFNEVTGLALDQDENLWVSNYGVDSALSVRTADGKWFAYRLLSGSPGEMVIDEYGHKWMALLRDDSRGICVFKEIDGPGSPGTSIILDANEGSGGLPGNGVNALAVDKDGEVWVGTDEGLAIFFNPIGILERGIVNDAQRIVIDDGRDIGYLLGSQVINDIYVDGANRKWIATNNGVWLVAEDGSEVLLHFTTLNSPLLSDIVKCVGVNGRSGEVFFGTEKGLISYRGDATEADDSHGDVVVFPNPVRPSYNGNITISGLPDNASVKITDIAGRVIFETLAQGGTAVWNGIGFNGQRPHTGVFLIFSADQDDEETLVSKLLFLH